MGKFKNILFILLVAILLMGIVLVLWPGQSKTSDQQTDGTVRIGIAVYDLSDPYITDYIDRLEKELNQTFDNPKYEIADAANSDQKQREQLDYFMQQNVDILLLNLVSSSESADVLNAAARKNLPVVMFNREPAEKDLKISDKFAYVGIDGNLTGTMLGELLSQEWEKNQTEGSLDHNGNGKLDLILIEGETGHYDTIRRTASFLSAINPNVPNVQLADITSDWSKSRAIAEMEKLSEDKVETAEAIVCGNDEIALGVLDFYKEKGLTPPLVLGINGSPDMREAIDQGLAFGTVDIGTDKQVDMICKLAKQMLTTDETPSQKIYYAEQEIYTNVTK